jgi:hypothetical protein
VNARKSVILLLSLVLLICLSACGGKAETKAAEKNQATVTYLEAKSEISQKKADAVKRDLAKMKEVKEVRGASLENDIYMALTVEGFDRFFLDRIRKGAHDRASKKYPEDNIHITTDKKLSSDLKKLETELGKNSVEKEEVKKRLKKIEDDMRG